MAIDINYSNKQIHLFFQGYHIQLEVRCVSV